MLDILHRELVYFWYYIEFQLSQFFRYWVLGMVLGSVYHADRPLDVGRVRQAKK